MVIPISEGRPTPRREGGAMALSAPSEGAPVVVPECALLGAVAVAAEQVSVDDRVSQPAPAREQHVSVTPPVTRRILERAPLSREERAHALFCCWGERYCARARHGVLIGDSQVFRHCVLRSGGGC